MAPQAGLFIQPKRSAQQLRMPLHILAKLYQILNLAAELGVNQPVVRQPLLIRKPSVPIK